MSSQRTPRMRVSAIKPIVTSVFVRQARRPFARTHDFANDGATGFAAQNLRCPSALRSCQRTEPTKLTHSSQQTDEKPTLTGADPLGRAKIFDSSFLILLGITAAATLGVFWTKGALRVIEIAIEYLGFLAVLSPKILCGFFIAASVPVLLPREVLARWIGQESGLKGLFVASLAGALVPGGPMMIFPLAAGFRIAGASVATLIAFVSAWSLYGLNRAVIWEMSFLHLDFVLLRILISLPFPILLGLIAARLFRRWDEARQ